MKTRNLIAIVFLFSACDGGNPPPVLDAALPLHLEDHVAMAKLESADVPEIREEVEWKFDEAQPEWKALRVPDSASYAIELTEVDDAIRVGMAGTPGEEPMVGGIYTELEDWRFEDWEAVVLRARTTGSVWGMGVELVLDDGAAPERPMFRWLEEGSPMFSDGEIQTYVFSVERPEGVEKSVPWKHLAFAFATFEEIAIDVVSMSVIPSEPRIPSSVGSSRRHAARLRGVLSTRAHPRV